MYTDLVADRTDSVTNTLVALDALLAGPFHASLTDVDGIMTAIRESDSTLLAPVLEWQTQPLHDVYLQTAINGSTRSAAIETFMAAIIDTKHVGDIEVSETALWRLANCDSCDLLRAFARHATPRKLWRALQPTRPNSRARDALIAVGAPKKGSLSDLRLEYDVVRERYEALGALVYSDSHMETMEHLRCEIASAESEMT
jgi:hypothetical protein